MGYDNRPKQMNNNYKNSKGNNFKPNMSRNNDSLKWNNGNKKTNGNGKSFNNTQKPQNTSFVSSKDRDDIYTPKVYAKKPKEKSMFDDIVIPEYLMDRQNMRNKRANDKKYKNKHKRDY